MDIRNRLLAYFGEAAVARLSPDIREISLSVGRILGEPGEPIDHVFFPTSGVISVVTLLVDGRKVESLTVGREGAVGLAGAFGHGRWITRGIVQIAGAALRISAPALRAVAEDEPLVLDAVLRYAEMTEAQLHQSAACNALHPIEARLARWLLTCEDRVGDHLLPLTHEFLAMMLGVQRTRVTAAAQTLQRQGLIDYRRGLITVKDRAALERAACECYATIEATHDRIFAPRSTVIAAQ
jgi:CRP-like cAMP-binding protein